MRWSALLHIARPNAQRSAGFPINRRSIAICPA
jgi:hypothetical protein